MRDQEIVGLWEAYQQVCETSANVGPVEMERDPGYNMTYAERQKALKDKAEKIRATKKEEFVGEDANYDRNRKRAAQRAAARNAARDAGKTGAVPGVGYVTPRRESETYRDSAGVERHKTGARMPQKEEVDLFDYILEHLVAEGYADTNEAAIAIMTNMSEEWREEIMEGMTMKDFKANRKKLQRKEASDDAKKRGHVDKFTGKPYGTAEAASRRRNLNPAERESRRKFAEDPD
jgi:hypothetical protein